MRARRVEQILRTTLLFAGCAAMLLAAYAAIGRAQGFLASRSLPNANKTPPLLLAQNPSTPFTLPQAPEARVSPMTPGTLPGTTAAAGQTVTGINPITGLPCSGGGALSVSGAGGLPGATAPPPGTTITTDQIPGALPPPNSVFSSGPGLGPC